MLTRALIGAAIALLLSSCGEKTVSEEQRHELRRLVRTADLVAEAWQPPSHRKLLRTAEDARFLSLALRVEAPGAPVENPCLSRVGNTCVETPLDPLFASLDALALKEATRPVTVSVLGNSLIASDRIVDRLRMRLVRHFGDGGRGVLLADRMARYGPRTRTAAWARHWEPRTLGELRPPPHLTGLTGVYHLATRDGARSRFELDGERRGTVWWLDVSPRAVMTISVDGEVVARTKPRGSKRSESTSFVIPEGARRLELVSEKRGAVVMGVVLQREEPGIVLDTFGVPSADANFFLRADPKTFRSQLSSRDPAMVMVMLGGNETKRLEWGRSTKKKVHAGLTRLLRRVRDAAPESACLVVGPIDAVRGRDTDEPGKQRPWLLRVNALQREAALAEGCAYLDLYAAMGAEGSLLRFADAGLVHKDLVHPRGRGLDLLGELLADAVLTAWVNARTPLDGDSLAAAWRALQLEVTPRRQFALPDDNRAPFSDGLRAGLRATGALADDDTHGERAAERIDPARLPLLEALEDPSLRPMLTELGWWDAERGALTRRAGLGTAALIVAQSDGVH